MTEESNFQQIMNEYFEKNKPPTLKLKKSDTLRTVTRASDFQGLMPYNTMEHKET